MRFRYVQKEGARLERTSDTRAHVSFGARIRFSAVSSAWTTPRILAHHQTWSVSADPLCWHLGRAHQQSPSLSMGDGSSRCVRDLLNPNARPGMKFRTSREIPSIFAPGLTTSLNAHGCGSFAYFLPMLRTNSRQRHTNPGKYGQLASRGQNGG